jgi:hypothetical protein
MQHIYGLELRDNQEVCIRCNEVWFDHDGTRYDEGFVCCDCDSEYLKSYINQYAEKYIKSDPEVTEAFHNYVISAMPDDERIELERKYKKQMVEEWLHHQWSYTIKELKEDFAQDDWVNMFDYLEKELRGR